MRQRKVRDLDAKLAAAGAYLIEDAGPDDWDRIFSGAGPDAGTQQRERFLEIGCGRGDFLLQQALTHPENDYIGIEGQPSVVLRAMEKAVEEGGPEGTGRLSNLRFVCRFVNQMDELFKEGSLSGVYLNFSDPWPKSRHAKRRLTWRGRLADYARTLKPGGFIAVKTDNDALFDFTLEEIEACGWKPAELSRDLHASGYEARLVMTEYEKKFREAGKNINYVKVVIDHR